MIDQTKGSLADEVTHGQTIRYEKAARSERVLDERRSLASLEEIRIDRRSRTRSRLRSCLRSEIVGNHRQSVVFSFSDRYRFDRVDSTGLGNRRDDLYVDDGGRVLTLFKLVMPRVARMRVASKVRRKLF